MIFPDKILEEMTDKVNEEISSATLDFELIFSKISSHSSEKLCEMIVSDRYLGFGEKISVMCMEELVKRRENGDLFDFENHIEEISKVLPDLGQLTLGSNLDIRSIIQQVVRNK